MIINNFDIVDIPVTPGKADTPLQVNPNAVLPFTVSVQSLKVIAWGNPQGFNFYNSL